MRAAVDAISDRMRGQLMIAVVGERGVGRNTLIEALAGSPTPTSTGSAGAFAGTRPADEEAHRHGATSALAGRVYVDVPAGTAPRQRPDVVIEVVLDHAERRWDLDRVWTGATPTPSPFTSITVVNRLDERAHGLPRLVTATEQPPPGCDHVVSARMAATAATISPVEFAALADLRTAMLESADGFVATPLGSTTADQRRHFLERFTLLGLRIASMSHDGEQGFERLQDDLRRASGIDPLRRRIDEQIMPRAEVIKALGVVNDLRALAGDIERFDVERASALVAAIDRAIADSFAVAGLRAAHLAALGRLGLSTDDVAELLAVTAGRLPPAVESANDRARQPLLLTTLARWRSFGDDMFAPAELREAAECVCRGLEHAYANLV
jgi:hypothetical protein